MSETSEVQVLEKISKTVGESQINITFSSQRIKAQAFLVDKLRKQSERQKEICNFINSSNLKLQTEIRQAEIEINSLLAANKTIKSSNVELNKVYLMLKERKSQIEERVKDGEKKYEDLWLQAKARYESIPFVQELIQAQNKAGKLKEDLLISKEKSDNLKQEIKIKKKQIADSDKKHIVALAQYVVHDLPDGLKTIKEKTKAIMEISKNIDEIMKQQEKEKNKFRTPTPIIKKQETEIEKRHITVADSCIAFSRDNPWDQIMMSQIQLHQSDLDGLNAKLEKIKTKKIDMVNINSVKRIYPIELESGIQNKKPKKEEQLTMILNKTVNEETGGENKKEVYSKRKLINILEYVKLDENDAYDIISKVNVDKLKEVDKIGTNTSDENPGSNFNDEKEQVIEDIEVVDLTKKSEMIVLPPTQFLDFEEGNYFTTSQQQVEVIVHMSMSDSSLKVSQNSRENKKKVCFDLPPIEEVNEDDNENDGNVFTPRYGNAAITDENEVNDIITTVESQADISLVSDESYTKMKDLMLKKHNLNLSPQFVYAKKNVLQMANSTDEGIITSKFFQSNKADIEVKNNTLPEVKENSQKCGSILITQNADNENMEVGEVVVSSPKEVKTTQKPDRSVNGLLFKHVGQDIPDSLNVSVSTTGFEEGYSDFPQCIDASLLLSPKADLSVPNIGDNVEISSQDVPNFLSGLRKSGFSFFGKSTTSGSKASTNEQNGNSFNFNFGRDEKKERGGLFNMFQ